MNGVSFSMGLFTDHYELTMAEGYFHAGQNGGTANFDYFFRKNPFGSGYTVFAGLDELLEMVLEFNYDHNAIDYLSTRGFSDDFLEYLKTFRFQGDIYAPKEGEIVFPNEPILRVTGDIIETQLLETLILNVLNFQSLIATKANRIRQSAGNRLLMEFGMRRAQGWAAVAASRAAIIGGIDSTSNVVSAYRYGIPSTGTMAHSWIQSFEDELTAFRAYAKTHPDDCILLVDTYHTLKSGIPNAIIVAKELEKTGHKLKGIRLDSGDLAYLSKQARKRLDENGLDYVKIVASNQLDEYIIKSLIEQGAPIESFGVGTNLITGRNDAALDGVYKLSLIHDRPTLKLSDDLIKLTLPGEKKVLRYFNGQNKFYADAIALAHENLNEITTIYHPHDAEKNTSVIELTSEAIQSKVMDKGKRLSERTSIQQSSDYRKLRISQLPDEHKRFEYPHLYKVGISEKLMQIRDTLVRNIKKET
ncbi:MAG: nicotinate phosphoribosyltransferase [Bacteroidales bacterium]|jgi:nicotinate phosphoribosyltransferase|nr:nicotinate phosphoribosyltransferase [Bacteroidales bacterium]MDD3701190.1 nicotinate phosphoribosyltransferase [Bacteroidales bacterium]MDY0368637.1 nicotinate phosphoribosyltransferase [Bacteroidales bacterium]